MRKDKKCLKGVVLERLDPVVPERINLTDTPEETIEVQKILPRFSLLIPKRTYVL